MSFFLFANHPRQWTHKRLSILVLSISSLVGVAGFSQDRTRYHLTWSATSVFSGQAEITNPDSVTYLNTTMSALWEGEAEIVRIDHETDETEVQVIALSYNGSYSLRRTSETHSSTSCFGGTGKQIIETLNTVNSDNKLLADQKDVFEQRLVSWAANALEIGGDMIVDPFKAGNHGNCYPGNFVVQASHSDWYTLQKCGVIVHDYGSTWEQDIPIHGLAGTDGDLMPVDAERRIYTKTAEASYDNSGTPVVTHWEIRLETQGDCELEVDPQYQDLGYYVDDCYDHSPDPDGDGRCEYNLGNYGCSVTCLAMGLTFAGYPTDPGALHEFILEPYPDDPVHRGRSLFRDGVFGLELVVECFTGNNATFRYISVESSLRPDLAEDMLTQIVCMDGYPAVAGVNIGAGDRGLPGHYVVVTGKEGLKWKINDPLSSGHTYLDEYGDFVIIGYIEPVGSEVESAASMVVAKAEPDFSKLIILADEKAEMKVIDQQGNRTGYSSGQTEVELGIPNSEYAYLGLQNAETKEWWPVGLQIFVIRQPATNEYRIELDGENAESYKLDVHSFDRDGGWKRPVEVSGTVDPGSKEAFKVEFDPTPGIPVSVNEVDPLIGGAPVEDLEGWFYSDWFGYYSTAFAPWLFHAEHGFIYRFPDSADTSLFIFDNAIGDWWWTGESVYPFLYVFDPPADNGGTDIESAWLFYFEGTKAPRSFGVVTGADAGAILFFDP